MANRGKQKTHKAVASRVRVTATGKLKHGREKTSHLMSGRSGDLKRKLGMPAILHEGHARNLRRYMGIAGLNPRKAAHDKRVAAIQAAKAEGETATEAA